MNAMSESNLTSARGGSEIEALLMLYRAALAAADPLRVVPPHLPAPPRGRTVVVGVGKAAAAMAQAVEQNWRGPLEGVVVVPQGAALPLTRVRVHEASHPVPDERSVEGARLLMQAVSGLSADDLVVALISGGGSALCAAPAPGLSLETKQGITRDLLRRGATISEINTVRRHLSAIKGGRLAVQAWPARVVTLLISDIPGDDPALIASGPTLADPSTCRDAWEILQRYQIDDNVMVRDKLAAGAWESIKPQDPRLARNTHCVVASAWDGLQAAVVRGAELGWTCHVLSDAMEGEARDLAKTHAALALSVANRQTPFSAPCILLSGGEATVTVRGQGRGGRNTEFMLAFALAIQAQQNGARIYGLSAGTDGLDGRAEAAGAWIGPETLMQLHAAGIDARRCLDDNDSASAFAALDALIHTGPTMTNINDFRAVIVEASR